MALAAWLAGGEARADSNCIPSQLVCYQTINSSAPRQEVSCTGPDGGRGFASFDIPAGTLWVQGWSGISFFTAQATMNDSFEVVGPAAGVPLDFTAELDLSGSAVTRSCFCCYGFAAARILEGSSNGSEKWFSPICAPQAIQHTLSIQVYRSVGEISAHVSAGGGEGGTGDLRGALRFSGLPVGVSVVSCNGFLQAPVPVASGSWGRLKSRYR